MWDYWQSATEEKTVQIRKFSFGAGMTAELMPKQRFLASESQIWKTCMRVAKACVTEPQITGYLMKIQTLPDWLASKYWRRLTTDSHRYTEQNDLTRFTFKSSSCILHTLSGISSGSFTGSSHNRHNLFIFYFTKSCTTYYTLLNTQSQQTQLVYLLLH